MSISTLSTTHTPLMLNTSDSKIDRDNGIGGNENEVKRIIENFTR